MKKILLVVTTFLLFATITNAQQNPAKVEHRKEIMNENKEMYKELNLSKDQKEKVKTIHQDAKTKREAIMNNSSLSKEEKKTQLQQLHQTTTNNINAILTPDQQVKFKTIQEYNKQQVTEKVAKKKELYEGLNLSQDQKNKIKTIEKETKTKREAIMNDGSLSKEDKKKQLQQLHESTQSSINSILTVEQKEQLSQNKKQLKEENKKH